ncbi:MAG: NAD(P)/FAD-dependent oxidoreductase [Chitinophagaceae bacterium]
MQQQLSLRLTPEEAANPETLRAYLVASLGVKPASLTGYHIEKRSIDARSKQPWINLTCLCYVDEPLPLERFQPYIFPDVSKAPKQVIIVGAGPAGLFAALKLIEKGIRPIVLERGKDVRARRRDLAAMNKLGKVNPESNYCFGEGGAGTYSDGKLYTRSTKRGDIRRILQLLVQFGAEESVLYDAHPHIGTNKLPQIITAMREQVIASGGLFLFEQKVNQFIIENNTVTGVKTQQGGEWKGEAVILATGHSARDIFHLLDEQQILIENKSYALGVRIEHPQALIDTIQYHCPVRNEHLPPASYSLVEQVQGHGVFSFCMCPGGIIAPAATAPGEVVVNGWSPSKRNNPYANSGMVVTVHPEKLKKFEKYGALAGMYFQQEIEQKAAWVGGGKLVAPAQRMGDMVNGRNSASLPDCSYLPGIHSADLREVLPGFIHTSLKEGFVAFGKKMRGYLTNEAVVVATESRTSSPVRIPRDGVTLQHPQIADLYPCGEGAGYAGGIVSAAMDGERVAAVIALQS